MIKLAEETQGIYKDARKLKQYSPENGGNIIAIMHVLVRSRNNLNSSILFIVEVLFSNFVSVIVTPPACLLASRKKKPHDGQQHS